MHIYVLHAYIYVNNDMVLVMGIAANGHKRQAQKIGVRGKLKPL